MAFRSLRDHFFLECVQPPPGCTRVYLCIFTYGRTSWLLPSFGSCEESSNRYPFMFLCGHKFSTPLGKYQGMQLLDCMVGVCLVDKRSPDCLTKCTHTSHSYEQRMRVPAAPVLASMRCYRRSGFWHSERSAVVDRCCFNLHFSDDE